LQELPQIYKDLIERPNGTVKFFSILPPSDLLAQTICALTNLSVGGTLFIGLQVDRPGSYHVKGLSSDFNVMAILNKALDLVSPRPDYVQGFYSLNGKIIFHFSAAPNGTPSFVNEASYYLKDGALVEMRLEEEAPIGASYARIGVLAKTISGSVQGTDARRKVLAHFLSALRLLATVEQLVLPLGPGVPTDHVDGRVLQRMLVCSLFDNFEIYLGDILFEIWLSNPQMLRSKAEVTLDEVLRCADMEEFIQFYARKRIATMAKGSIKKFISENPQIDELKAIPKQDQEKIDKLMQIRHLYTHRNGTVDDRFAAYYNNVQLGSEYVLSVRDILDHLEYLITIVQAVDNAAITKHGLATT
jgi:hypothetical protein